jgi:hypothetical protein
MELEHHADLAAQLAQRRRGNVGAAGEDDAVDRNPAGLKSFEAGGSRPG